MGVNRNTQASAREQSPERGSDDRSGARTRKPPALTRAQIEAMKANTQYLRELRESERVAGCVIRELESLSLQLISARESDPGRSKP